MASTDPRETLDLSRPEAWAVHAALLARIERETDDGNGIDREMTLLETVESDEYGFEAEDLRLLREALSAYLADAPDRDRPPGRAVLEDVRAALA